MRTKSKIYIRINRFHRALDSYRSTVVDIRLGINHRLQIPHLGLSAIREILYTKNRRNVNGI